MPSTLRPSALQRVLIPALVAALLGPLVAVAPMTAPPVAAAGDTWYVAYGSGSSTGSPNGDCANPSFQGVDALAIWDAQNHASNGDVIHICTGAYDFSAAATYPGPVTTAKTLTFEGDSSTSTTIDGGDTAQLFNGGNLTFQDLTLQHGAAPVADSFGGAIHSSNVGLTRVRVLDNTAGVNGGAVWAGGDVTIVDSLFERNSAGQYGGAVIQFDYYNARTITVTGSSFTGNQAAGSAGAVASFGGRTTVFISTSSFVDNTSGGRGGAIAAYAFVFEDPAVATDVTLAGNVFSGNRAGDSGGAVSAEANASPVVVTSSGNTFTSNRGIGDGGGLYVTGSLHSVGDDFDGNASEGRGGGIGATGAVGLSDGTFASNSAAQEGGALWANGDVAVTDGTFTENTAGTSGGAIRSGASTLVTGGSFTRNSASTGDGGAIAGKIVTSSNAFFTGNRAFGGPTAQYGGAIWSEGTITSTTDVFTDNSAGVDGGALAQAKVGDGAMVRYGTFSGNSAGLHGGAIFVPSGEANIGSSTFSGNSAANLGGAVYNGGSAVLLVETSTFTDNTAGGSGGAIYQTTDSSRIKDSTFARNRAAVHGGALWSNGTPIKIWNDTFADNSSGSGYGGAVGSLGGDVTVLSVTFVGNRAPSNITSGALYSGGGAMTVANTIFGSDGDECNQAGGTYNDLGGNIDVSVSGSGCIANVISREIATAGLLGLGSLADNGGPTFTISISDDSVARAYGVPWLCYDGADVNNSDQRGIPYNRHASTANHDPVSLSNYCDSGAFENQSATVPPALRPQLLVTADDSSGTFGSAPPTIGWTAATDGSSVSSSDIDWSPASAPTCKAYLDATYAQEVTAGTPVGTSYVTHCTGPSSATSGDGSIDYVVSYTDGTYEVVMVTPSVTYTGSTTVNSGSSATLSASLTPSACTGVSGSTYTFTPDPATGTGTASFPSGATSTVGWLPGTYDIAIDYPGDANCDASSGTGSMTVTAVSVVLLYTGPTIVYHASGTSAPVSLTASVTPALAGCIVGFVLSDGGSFTSPTYYATTNNRGIATTSPITVIDGAYEVTVSTGGGCSSPPDFTGTLTVSLGTLGKGSVGGGWYKHPTINPPRIGFGYTIGVTSTTKKVGSTTTVTTTTKGQMVWVSKAGWRLKAAINYSSTSGVQLWTTVTCPGSVGVTGSSPKCGTFSGTGVLQQWDATLNGGLGGWKSSTYGTVSFVVTVWDGGQMTTCKSKTNCTTTIYPDSFGITMKQGTTVISAPAVPVSSPQTLWGGEVKIW